MRIASPPFRFDAREHTYTMLDTGEEVPSITQMLQATGWVDDHWFTDGSRDRGREIHRLTADYDLGALDPLTCVSRYRGYLLGHVKMMTIERPTIRSVEEPVVHPTLHFGGRPDRVVELRGVRAVLEIKSGAPARSHAVQTALQAYLAALETDLEPWMLARYALYLTATGRFVLEEHKDRRDFDEARRIIRQCCGV